MKRLTLCALAALPLVLLGCASAQRQYERGMELEVQGRFGEAARYYAQAIQRDPDLNTMVRGRLRESGRQAVEGYVRDARAYEQAGQWPEAADRFRDADAILELGRSVGEPIAVPHGFSEHRRAAFDGAIEALAAAGEDARERLDFPEALRHYERAGRFDPSREQADALLEGTAVTRLAWAESLLAAGRFRQAFEVAEQGAALRSRYGDAFRDLQDEAVQLGTVRLAALPVQRLSGDLAALPPRFTDELTLLAEDEHWSRPPLFVLTADPRDVRALTRRRLGRDVLVGNARLTADLGRDLGADFAVAAGVERFAESRGEERRTSRTARLRRGGARATYTEVRTPTTFRSTVRFEVVEVATRRVVCNERLDRSADGPVLRAEYDGDPRELDLSRAEQDLFLASGAEDQERLIQERLAEQLAEALAARAYACVVARVP